MRRAPRRRSSAGVWGSPPRRCTTGSANTGASPCQETGEPGSLALRAPLAREPIPQGSWRSASVSPWPTAKAHTATKPSSEKKLAEIDAAIQAATPTETVSLSAAADLLSDLPRLWDAATLEERQRLIAPLIDRVYVDIDLRCIAAIDPTPAFRSLLEGAVQTIAQPTFVLIEATKDVDWAQWWTWWRRGRVELPVQRRAKLRSYRRFRRLVLVRWVVAGPAVPD